MKKSLSFKILLFFVAVLSIFSAAFLIYSHYFLKDVFFSLMDGPTSILTANGAPIFQDLLRFDFSVPLGVVILLAAPIVVGIITYRMGKEKGKS
ncbi:MAG: hypothetical protein E7L17_08520 [Clostridium sp.]|uniref:hypothetical protein n=1 Tax=Clostridium sp. TaxID=1506 RepID=UPI00290A58E8|nr:hypothetical protein [Clostridium sp.]MDU7338143.1 hypothetical protein [Clostridium sp.]